MENRFKPRSMFSAIALGAVLFFFASIAGLLLLASFALAGGGTATLPNGATANIHGSFGCSTSPTRTEINAGGHLFAFTTSAILIDGVQVQPLDASVKDVRIESGFWTASLHVNGHEIRPRR